MTIFTNFKNRFKKITKTIFTPMNCLGIIAVGTGVTFAIIYPLHFKKAVKTISNRIIYPLNLEQVFKNISNISNSTETISNISNSTENISNIINSTETISNLIDRIENISNLIDRIDCPATPIVPTLPIIPTLVELFTPTIDLITKQLNASYSQISTLQADIKNFELITTELRRHNQELITSMASQMLKDCHMLKLKDCNISLIESSKGLIPLVKPDSYLNPLSIVVGTGVIGGLLTGIYTIVQTCLE